MEANTTHYDVLNEFVDNVYVYVLGVLRVVYVCQSVKNILFFKQLYSVIAMRKIG